MTVEPNPIKQETTEEQEELTPEERALAEGERNRIHFCRRVRKRVRDDKDAIIVLSGTRGVGKSVCACKLGKLIDPKFAITKNTLFDPRVDKLRENIYNYPAYSAHVVDELFRISYKRNWASQGNKALNELCNLCRYRNQVSLMCIPTFSDIDSGLRNVVSIWIAVIDRGIAVAFAPDKNPFTADAWHLRENERLINEDLRGRKLYSFTDSEFIRMLSKTPNYFGWFTFPDWTPEERTEYLSLKQPYDTAIVEESATAQANKITRERIARVENSLGKTITAMVKEGFHNYELEALTGLPKTKIGSIFKDANGVTLEEYRKNNKIKNRVGEYALTGNTSPQAQSYSSP